MNKTNPNIQELTELVAELEEEVKNTTLNDFSLKTTDLSEMADPYLGDKAKEVLKVKCNTYLNVFNEDIGNGQHLRKVASPVFLSITVRTDKIQEGVEVIAKEFNRLAELGAVKSVMTPISTLKLAPQYMRCDASGVYCFFHANPEFYDEAKKSPLSVEEGGTGKELHSLDVERKPGEFFVLTYITAFSRFTDKKKEEVKIFEIVNDYLKILPEGTKLVDYRIPAGYDLNTPVELKFYNSKMKDFKEVQIKCTYYNTYDVETNEFIQFNLLSSVKYIKNDDSIVEW